MVLLSRVRAAPQWAERGGRGKDRDREPSPRRRATYTRPHGVRHLFAAYDLANDQLYGLQVVTRANVACW